MKPGIGTWALFLSAACAAPAVPISAANRTSGVAPLAVFFDVVKTGDPLFDPMNAPTIFGLADFHFEWNFGDDDAARWSTNDRPKNRATGFVAAHVYESPGQFSVTLRVTTPDGTTHDFEQTITVLDPEVVYANSGTSAAERTYYVSAAGSDSNNGSFDQPLRGLDYALSRVFFQNGPRRLLLRRGESFAGRGITVPSRSGPFTIGAFGEGPAPVIQLAEIVGASLHFSRDATDVRIVDVDVSGPSLSPAITPGTNTLVLRSTIRGAGSGISTSDRQGNKAGSVIADCRIESSTNYSIYYNFGEHVAFLGNVLDRVAQEHVIRCYLTHSVIAHNQLLHGVRAKHMLKFVGYHPTGDPLREPGIPTEVAEYSIIADNRFDDPGPVSWQVTLGPTDSSKDQRLAHVIFERNVLHAGPSTSNMLYLNNSLVTVRNNVFDATGAPNTAAVRVAQRGLEPPPCGHRILHNTMYRSDTARLVGVQVDAPALSIFAHGNLVSAPNAIDVLGEDFRVDACGNLATVNAGFAAPERGDFTLRPNSPAMDQGETMPSVFSDFLGVVRPVDGDGSGVAQEDIGALEFIPTRPETQRVPSTWPVEKTPRPYLP